MSRIDVGHTEWTDRFSDYLSGDLGPDDHHAVEEHLDGCGRCRTVLAELRSVIGAANALGDIEPPRDLWSGIAATIEAPLPVERAPDTKVIALPTASAATRRSDQAPVRGLFFTTPQLIAASIALIAASALVTWSAGPGLGVQAEGPASETEGAVSMVSTGSAPPAGIAAELEALEVTLAEVSSALDPNTVRVLERNLAVIEQAIEDSRKALAQDPGNEFLAEHLDRVYRRKLTYLRDAAHVVEWSS